jgi:hypothetical protein
MGFIEQGARNHKEGQLGQPWCYRERKISTSRLSLICAEIELALIFVGITARS